MQAGYRLVMATQFRRFTYRSSRTPLGTPNEELGRGGSGVVYRGVLDKTTVVAVKRLTNVVQGEEEFWAEMTVFGRINHINLTTTDGGERLEMWQIAQALKQVVASGDIMSLVDSRLNGQFNPRQAMEMVKISLSCMEERNNRPTMDDISKALTACDDEDEHPAYLS
ncbi:hypothetical protein ZWY2020_004220 [Hordeum vulgare]|nr:hypothetical protein ZWY2020_004220 [Hordeum vulgare]